MAWKFWQGKRNSNDNAASSSEVPAENPMEMKAENHEDLKRAAETLETPDANAEESPRADVPAPADPAVSVDADALKERVIDALQTVYDPEIPVNIYELGLIYKVEVSPDGKVRLEMTLTSPNCPAAASMPAEIETKVKSLEGVTAFDLELVWDPSWNMEMMSEAARLQLGF